MLAVAGGDADVEGYVKIRDGQVANRPIYVALAVTVDDGRDILGLWADDDDCEGCGDCAYSRDP